MTDDEKRIHDEAIRNAEFRGEMREAKRRLEEASEDNATRQVQLANAFSTMADKVMELAQCQVHPMRPRAHSLNTESFTRIIEEQNEKQTRSIVPAAVSAAAEAATEAVTTANKKQWLAIAVAVGTGLATTILTLLQACGHH